MLTLLDIQIGVHSSHFSIIWTYLLWEKAFRKMVLKHFRVFTYIGLIFVFIFSFGFDNLKRYSQGGTTVIKFEEEVTKNIQPDKKFLKRIIEKKKCF